VIELMSRSDLVDKIDDTGCCDRFDALFFVHVQVDGTG
jgi:hypothetical protein